MPWCPLPALPSIVRELDVNCIWLHFACERRTANGERERVISLDEIHGVVMMRKMAVCALLQSYGMGWVWSFPPAELTVCLWPAQRISRDKVRRRPAHRVRV